MLFTTKNLEAINSSEPVMPRESVFYALDFERGQKPNLSAGIPLVRAVEYLHYHNGIPIVGDILSVAVAGNEIVKIRSCWHKIVGEKTEEKRKVVDVAESLAVAAEILTQKFQNRNLRLKLRRAELCYYGFHDVGRPRKLFVPAWHFTFEKDAGVYSKYVKAHSNKAINSELDIANARRKQKK
jgi:hypothetical protein